MEHYAPLKRWHSDTCYNMDDLEEVTLSEITQTQKRQILHDSTHIRHPEWSNSETERMMVSRV